MLEAQDAISEELRASTFHPPTLDMMAPFGITARMLEAGLVCPTWQIPPAPSGERAVFDLSILKMSPASLSPAMRAVEVLPLRAGRGPQAAKRHAAFLDGGDGREQSADGVTAQPTRRRRDDSPRFI